MEEVFNVEDGDFGLVISLVREANILLASHEGKNDYNQLKNRLYDTINVMRAIERTDPMSRDDIDFILNTIHDIWDRGILTPLTLQDDEFNEEDGGIQENKRSSYIIKRDGKIYNLNAYKVTVIASYSHDTGVKINNEIFNSIYCNPTLYITKNGCLTGEYINQCIIRKSAIDRHCFTLQSVVNVQASVIYKDPLRYFAVDFRDPKLKVLREFYDVPSGMDESVRSYKMNIRKYKKRKELCMK